MICSLIYSLINSSETVGQLFHIVSLEKLSTKKVTPVSWITFPFSGLYYALINLNLETNSIVQIQKDLQKQYLEVLLKTYADLFNSIIDKDDFTPLVVSTQEEEFTILQAFPLNAGMTHG